MHLAIKIPLSLTQSKQLKTRWIKVYILATGANCRVRTMESIEYEHDVLIASRMENRMGPT